MLRDRRRIFQIHRLIDTLLEDRFTTPNVNEQYFPVAFAALWLAITTTLGLFSGWFLLMWKYPDRKEEALLQLRRQSGSMGLGVACKAY